MKMREKLRDIYFKIGVKLFGEKPSDISTITLPTENVVKQILNLWKMNLKK
jgi:hypothetical protein